MTPSRIERFTTRWVGVSEETLEQLLLQALARKNSAPPRSERVKP